MTALRVGFDTGPLFGPKTGIGFAVEALHAALRQRDDVELHDYLVSFRARPAATTRRLPLPAMVAQRCWAFAGHPLADRWLGDVQVVHGTNYVVATGKAYSIEDLVRLAFAEIGIDDWQQYVRQDPKFFRPAEVDLLIGDPTKAKEKLGWEPEVQFPELVKMMVANDLKIEGAKVQ